MGLIKNAKAIEAPAKAAKKSDKAEFEVAGLAEYAKVDALAKAIDTVKKTLGAEVKAAALPIFMKLAENGKRPENFRGVDPTDPNVSASVELRMRASTSPLNEAELELCQANKIETKTVTITQELFAINPKYASDAKLITKVEKALATLVPDDFFVHQEEVKKEVVSEEAIEKAFADHAPVELVSILTVQALKPKLAEVNIASIMKDVSDYLVEKEEVSADGKKTKAA